MSVCALCCLILFAQPMNLATARSATGIPGDVMLTEVVCAASSDLILSDKVSRVNRLGS